MDVCLAVHGPLPNKNFQPEATERVRRSPRPAAAAGIAALAFALALVPLLAVATALDLRLVQFVVRFVEPSQRHWPAHHTRHHVAATLRRTRRAHNVRAEFVTAPFANTNTKGRSPTHTLNELKWIAGTSQTEPT
jgi:hypothetical protein